MTKREFFKNEVEGACREWGVRHNAGVRLEPDLDGYKIAVAIYVDRGCGSPSGSEHLFEIHLDEDYQLVVKGTLRQTLLERLEVNLAGWRIMEVDSNDKA